MKKILLILVSLLIFILLGLAGYWFFFLQNTSFSFISPLSSPKPKPLDKYTFESLKNNPAEKSQIVLAETIKDDPDYIAQIFSYPVEGKKMTGQINIPKSHPPKAGYPVIIMIRGFIDPAIYKTGDGTRRAAAIFAKNGFITLAPDFLGFGGSDDPDPDSIAARLERPSAILTLLNSFDQLPQANSQKLSLWGHSNGGQIALSILEITGEEIPTTLWAPVSKGFPYSILYYTDEFDDQGKALRQVLAQFEATYDVDNYSIHKYFDQINAPIQIHQGTADDAVPQEWSDQLVKDLHALKKSVTYFVYPGANHDLQPAWELVVQRDISFFKRQLSK